MSEEPKIFYINNDLIMFDEDTGKEFILESDLEEFISQFKVKGITKEQEEFLDECISLFKRGER